MAMRSRPARSIDILRETARNRVVRHTKIGRAMSALGQKQTLGKVRLMSALPPKADIDRARRDVRIVSKADIESSIRSPRRQSVGNPE